MQWISSPGSKQFPYKSPASSAGLLSNVLITVVSQFSNQGNRGNGICLHLVMRKRQTLFCVYAPESHLLHRGEKYAVVLGAVQLHWAHSVYLVFCRESYTSDSITIPLATSITWYKEEQTVHLKGGNVVPSRKKGTSELNHKKFSSTIMWNQQEIPPLRADILSAGK